MSSDIATSPAAPLLTSVLDELGREIISGELPEGHTFTLQSIGERFDISRTVSREAMRALEQLGLVSSSRRVGITVLARSAWAVFDPTIINWRLQASSERDEQLRSLTELRIAVEPIAAFNCATNASTAQRAELVRLSGVLRELGENNQGTSEEFLKADVRFHTLLLEASGNDMFVALSEPLLKALYGRTEFGMQPQAPAPEALEAHEELARAIEAGAPEEAESASRALIAEVRQALKDSPRKN